MKKTVILLAIVVLWAVGAQGQRFDWAKGYGSSMQESGCRIQGSLTDSAGNLYILGQYRFDSRWDDEYLRPSEPPYFDVGSLNLLIAKITPDGTMAWKKVVQGSDQNASSLAYDIKPLGDTGFAVMFQASNSFPGSRYLYWLDSLHMNDQYPLNPYQYADRRFAVGTFTAWLAFDFDGNVKEQYIIELSGVDTNGNDIMTQPYPHQPDSLSWLVMKQLVDPSFDVDAEGNIYICRDANNQFDALEDNLGAIKVWVNQREVGIFPVEKKPEWVPHLLKFAPHFDTMLNNKYLIQKSQGTHYSPYNYLKIDKGTNLYVLSTYSTFYPVTDTLVIDSSSNKYYIRSAEKSFFSYLAIFDSIFSLKELFFLSDSVIDSTFPSTLLVFNDVVFDYDSNYLVLAANSGRSFWGDTNRYYSVLQYRGVSLDMKSDAFFIVFKRGSSPLELYSYGHIPSIIQSGSIPHRTTNFSGNIACKYNRLFLQANYGGGLHSTNYDTIFNNQNKTGLGLAIFDYKGTCVNLIDYNSYYNTSSPLSYPENISLKDSTIYLITQLKADADFGEHHVYAAGYDPFVCIAKYVDTSFMTPYVYVPDDSVHIKPADRGGCHIYPNPAQQKVYIESEESVSSVTAITAVGAMIPLMCHGQTIDISPLPAGIYILEITTPTNKYHHKIIKL